MEGRSLIERWNDDDKMFLQLHIKEKLYPTILGAIVADALGVPVEFKRRGSYEVTDMIGYGTYNQPPGTWSDDTSLTMCLIENIMEENDMEGLMNKFIKYVNEGYWTPYGKMFDIGRTTVDSIRRYNLGYKPESYGGKLEQDNGNGALMRIMPLVFILWDEEDEISFRKTIESVCNITHAHPRSTLGCIFYVKFMIHLMHNNKPMAAYDRAVKYLIDNYTNDSIYSKELQYYSRIIDKSLLTLEKDHIKSDGYVINTLEASLWSFMTTSSYKEAVLKAVNLGDDTDTVGLITGTMAGITYMIEDIPKEWIEKLAGKDIIDDICNRFYKYVSSRSIIKKFGSDLKYSE